MRIFDRHPRTVSSLAVLAMLSVAALVLRPGADPQRTVRIAAARNVQSPERNVSSGLLRRFGVLGRTRRAAHGLGGRTEGIPTSAYYVEHMRVLAAASPVGTGAARRASEAFVAPGPRGRLCVLVIPPGFDGPGGTCVTRIEALTGGAVWAANAGGGRSEIVGLVPDGVGRVRLRSSGALAILPVVANSYSAQIRGAPREVSYRERSGHVRRIPFGG